MEIGPILQRAWQIIWKNKILVVFGLLPYLVTALVFLTFLVDVETMARWSYEQDYFWLYLLLASAVILLSALTAVLALLVVVRGTILAGEGTTRLTSGGLLRAGRPYLLPGLGVYALYALVFGSAFSLLTCLGLGVSVVTAGVGFLCLAPVFLLMVPVTIVAEVWLYLSVAAASADRIGVFEAIERGWGAIRRNFGPLAILALILYFGRTLLMGLVATPFYAMLYLPLFFAGDTLGSFKVGTQISHWLSMAYYPILAIGQAIITTYLYAAWTTAYLRLSPRLVPAAAAAEPQQGVLP